MLVLEVEPGASVEAVLADDSVEAASLVVVPGGG